MSYPVIIRRHLGVTSYLVLDQHPRELLRHPGFVQEFSIRLWLGSQDPVDAREEWAEMLAEDVDNFIIVDDSNWEFRHDRHLWEGL